MITKNGAQTKRPQVEFKHAVSTIGLSALSEVRTAFGIDNAKQLDVAATVRFFVPQAAFSRLFVAKNQILLGARGSGKTTWVRMLAHDHVTLAAKDPSERMGYARAALQANLIGIYVPASAAFAGDLRNKTWQTEEEAEKYFVWRLNLHACSALTHIISTCVEQYATTKSNHQKIISEISGLLGDAWSDGEKKCSSISELHLLLSTMELKHQTEIRRRRTSSAKIEAFEDHFDNDLLLPLRNSINIIKSKIRIPSSAVWMICLDEVEYLSPLHHRILNPHCQQAAAGRCWLIFGGFPRHLTDLLCLLVTSAGLTMLL
jgi:predicted ATPase